ncbi:MAG: hypothetical protein EPN47_13120 [Acidobacteria bacterium]|nr:MAG: hypothetical protein EPN47_13120 [Acidobacteriota bacterium]
MKNLTGLPQASTLETCSDDFLEVLGTLVHKLSQPLTSLQGTVEVALMGELDVAECRRILEISLQETQRMAKALSALRAVLEMEGAGSQTQPLSWTRTIENMLEEAASIDEDYCPRLVSAVQGEVWVKASPRLLQLATARLIGGAVRVARDRRAVRIILSVAAETASLTVCEDHVSSGSGGASGLETRSPSGKPVLEDIDRWVVSRAIECQGGRLNVSQTSESRFYQLNVPLATP